MANMITADEYLKERKRRQEGSGSKTQTARKSVENRSFSSADEYLAYREKRIQAENQQFAARARAAAADKYENLVNSMRPEERLELFTSNEEQYSGARKELANLLGQERYAALKRDARNTYIPAQFGQQILDRERSRQYAQRYQNTYVPASLAEAAIHRSGAGSDFTPYSDAMLRGEYLSRVDTNALQVELDALNEALDADRQRYNRTKIQFASYGDTTANSGAKALQKYISDYDEKQARAGQMERDLYEAKGGQTAAAYEAESFQVQKRSLDIAAENGSSDLRNMLDAVNGTYYLDPMQHFNHRDVKSSLMRDYATDKERETFNYLAVTKGEEGAMQYVEALMPKLNARSMGAMQQSVAEQGRTTGGKILNSVESVLLTPFKVAGALGAAADSIQGKYVDYNANYFMPGAMQQAQRANASENMGEAGNFLYQTGMSIAGFLTLNAATGGLGSVGQAATLGTMGLGSAGDATRDAFQRGASQKQALQVGALAGIAEVLFEKISLDSFIKLSTPGTRGSFLKNVLKQAGIEASEEVATEIANIIADEAVMGDLSNYNLAVKAYVAGGMSREEAERKASLDSFLNVLLAGAGGALSGGTLGTVGQIAGNVRATSIGRNNGNISTDALIQAALSMPERSSAHELAQQMSDGSMRRNNTSIGHLMAAYAQEGGDLSTLTAPAAQQQSAESTPDLRQAAYEMAGAQMDADIQTDAPQAAQTAVANNAVSEAAQIRPVEGAASNVGDIPTDTAKTAQTSVATSDSEVPGALKAVAPQEAAEKLSHSLLRGSESVISEVYADEDGAVSVRIGDRPITMDAREAQAMAAYYDGSVDAVDYVTGFHSVYGLAAQGSTLQQIKGGSSFFGAELTQEQLAGAYNAGHNVYAARQQAATANAAHNAELHARADAERTELELARKRAEALDPASQSFQPGVNRITDGKLSRKQRAQLRVLDAIGKKYGVEIVVDDGLYYDENGEMINSSDANAMFNRETGRIHINLNAVGEAYLAVGMHELVHYVQEYNAEGYSTLETVVLGALEERGEDVNALIRYQMEQFGYSEQLAREEVVANTLPAILNDEAYVKKLVSMDRTLAERIRDFIADFVSFVNETLRTLEGGASWKQMRSIREDTEMLSAIGELFDVALEGVPARRGEASTGGERFSIKYDVNNRPFVVVDEDILKTVPQTKWIDTVKQTLARRFPNGVRVGSDTIKINSQTRREFTYSEYTKWLGRNDKSAYADKFRASSNVDEIILASHGYINEGLKHARKDNIKDFARGGVLLRIGTTDYSADVIVGTTANGDMLLYDIVNLQRTNIQQKRSRHIVQSPLVGNRRSDISAIDNIPQSGTSVNPSIRNSAPENSGEGELFDAAPEGTSGKRNTSVANAKYSVNPAFQAQYDAWDGKNANTRFFVGKTSQTLRYVGVKNQEIVWDASKIIKVKQDHPAMSDEIIKRVPSVIENPIIVMESKTVPGRITMFGELADADGAPVLVALELEPTKDYRLNMEVIKIASAYGKDTSPQKLLDESLVLFVDPNKNRTQTWLKLYKLQLPSSAKYGLNGRVTYKNNSVNPSIRENVQKNAKDGGGARFSIRDNMTEAERYEELKNAELSVATYDVDASKLTRAEVARLENATRRDARQYVKTLYEKFGINDKRYENPSAKIEFAFSGRGIDKSIHEENERGARFADFGKMLASFDEIVENAIPIEIHPDKYAGTRRADPLLERTYVLVSGYEDGGVVPVQFEIKEYREQENQLYVAITLNKIETGIPVTAQRFQQNTGVLSVSPPASTISLRDLFANINPADGEFLKYVPDGFLNAEQRYAKQEALKKEQRKISNLRFSAKDERSVSIKQQIAAHQDELNKISPAATIESGIRPRKNGKPDRTLIRKGLQAFYGSLKYSVERQGFGKVSFDESALSELVHYIKDDAEFAAAKAAPAVVKRGVFVEHHTEHKGRNSVESFTIAAPVVLNGKRGNEAVVVQRTNRNKPHCVRILMPDGGGFDLDVIAKADQDRSAAATKSGRQQLIESASFNSISEADENSNLRFSLKDTSPVDVNELRAGNEKLRRALDLAEDQVKLTAGHKVKEGYVGTLAKRILKEYNSSFDYDTFKANLIKVFEYLSHAKNPNMAEVEEMTIGLMKRVIEKSNTFDAAGYEAYAGVRSYLRETGVSLSEDQKLEAAVLSDTYGAYRASLFGSVKLTNDGIALDSAWQEQSGLRPEARGKPVPALTEK